MKSTLILFIIIFQFQNISGQNKIYFDKDWKTTNKENAAYYRLIAKKNDSLYAVKDYYINGVLQMDGHTTSLEKDIFQGTVHWYAQSGKKTITRNYKNGILEGDAINYTGPFSTRCQYKNYMPYNGTIYNNNRIPAQYVNYTDGKKEFSNSYYKNSTQMAIKTSYYYHKKYQSYYPLKDVFYDKNNQVIGTLNYLKNQSLIPDNGTKITFYLDDKQPVSVKSKTNYTNSILEGETITYHKSGKEWLKGFYKEGSKFNGEFLERNIKTSYKNGVLIEKIKFDKNFNILAKLVLKEGKPYEGSEYIYNGVVTYYNGKLKSRKDYYDYKHQQLKRTTTCSDNTCTIEWYNKQGKFLGTGTSRNNTIIDGLEVAYNKLVYYKGKRKNGIQKEYKTELLKELIAKALYKNDTIVWTKTKKPLANSFFHCDYKNNEPFEGVEYAYDYNNTKYYKEGKLEKEIAYKRDPKTKKLSVQLIRFYDPTSKYKAVSKEIEYVKGKEYVLTFKNYSPYSGMSWLGSIIFTYKNGKREGVYQVYDIDKTVVVEKGNYVNDIKQGVVTYTPLKNEKHSFFEYKPSTCTFVDDHPFNGTVSTKRETTHYVNGEKTGVCSTYFDVYTDMLARKTTYKNDKKEGEEITYLIHNKILRGVYKNNKPFSGEFYSLKTNEVETYVNGKKHGAFVVFNDYKIKQIQHYEKGTLLSEKTSYSIKNDSIIGEGIYKDNLPYQGKFVTKQKNYKEYLVSPYVKGVKEGEEKLINTNYEAIKIIASTTYKNGKKEGAYQSSYYFSKATKPINGIYKNNKPFKGEFITTKDDKFRIISKFKNGKKEGYEIYYFNGKIDSLLYKKGKPIEGIQYELIKEPYTKNILKHFYKNGKKYKTILKDKTRITYSNNGFVIDSIKYYTKVGYDKIRVVFNNKKHTSGTITYYVENSSIGEFEFKEGVLLKGKMAYDGIVDKVINGFEITVKENTIETILKAHKKFNIYSVLFLPNKIPHKLTYKNYKLLLNGLIDFADKTQKITLKQYLLDGTFISEATYNNEKKSGVFVNFKEQGGNIVYSIDYHKKGEDKPTRIKGLSFDEMLEELKKINAAK